MGLQHRTHREPALREVFQHTLRKSQEGNCRGPCFELLRCQQQQATGTRPHLSGHCRSMHAFPKGPASRPKHMVTQRFLLLSRLRRSPCNDTLS